VMNYSFHDNSIWYAKVSWLFCKGQLVFLLNRTEPNFWSGSGSVHQISVRVRVRFIKSRFRFGFGSSNLGSGSIRFIKSQFRFGSVHWSKGLVRVRFGSSNLSSGSGSVRFNHVMLYFISKKSVTIASVRKSFFAATNCNKIVFSSTEILFSLR